MNHRLKGRKIIHGDILDPEIPIAEFSEDFTPIEREKLVATLDYGHEMLLTFKSYRNSLNIYSVVNLMDDLEKILTRWEYAMRSAQRRGEQA